MLAPILWLLIAVAGGSSTTPTVLAKFKYEKDCFALLAQVERKSAERTGMSYIKGMCVQATDVLP